MDLNEIDWTPCIVFGAAGNLRFGCPLKTGISVLIPPWFNVQIGDFIDLKYKPLTVLKPNNRAKHVATATRESEQPVPTIKVVNDTVVFFYTCAQVREFDQFENRRVTLLHDNMFGCIIDLDQKLPLLQVGTIVAVQCRLKESPRQKHKTIFIVTNYSKDHRMQERVESSGGNALLLNAQRAIPPDASSIRKLRNASPQNNSRIPRLCDLSLSAMSLCDQQVQAVPKQGAPAEPKASSQKIQIAKTMNKYAAKSKADLLFTIFENDVMLDALKKVDKDLWAHVSNIIAVGE